jgi:hypothetical protein
MVRRKNVRCHEKYEELFLKSLIKAEKQSEEKQRTYIENQSTVKNFLKN